VVARAQSTDNYYALVLRPDDTAALLRVIGGRTTTLATMRVAVRTGATYDLTFRVVGSTLTGWVEGVGFSASDGFLRQGPAGLTTTWTTASFDNAWVRT
jgi:pectate lyase